VAATLGNEFGVIKCAAAHDVFGISGEPGIDEISTALTA